MIVNTPRRRIRRARCTSDAGASSPEVPIAAQLQSKAPTADQSSTTDGSDIDSNPPPPRAPPPDDADSDSDTDNEEPWVDYIRRSTHRAEQLMRLHNVTDWVTEQRRSHWRLAAHVAAQPATRWARKAVQWHPSHTASKPAYRNHGGQRKRWDDDLRAFLGKNFCDDAVPEHQQRQHGDINDTSWLNIARQSATWQNLEIQYVNAI